MSENKLAPRLKFHQNHLPAMDSGNYSITIDGSVSHDKIKDNNTISTKNWKFSVFGERFSLTPKDIRSQFPNPGSTGHYASILPHIIFNRNTLPWERHGNASDETSPWMALLLFDENEQPEKKIIKVQDLNLPAKDKEAGQKEDEKLTVIDVPKSVLQKILPTTSDLTLLAHTRQGVDKNHNLVGEENAVIFCNRLPEQGKRSTMHLVSVEKKYDASTFNYGTSNTIRLVSLKSWEFYTLEHFKITSKTLSDVKNNATADEYKKLSTLLDEEFAGTESSFLEQVKTQAGITDLSDDLKNILPSKSSFNKTFDGLLTHLNKDILTLKLPDSGNTNAKKYLSQGKTPLLHQFRNGDRSVSWYRGPFMPTPNSKPTLVRDLKPETADELTQFIKTQGLFDITYSAAWEIGRLMALASKDFSTSLFQWKRLVAQHQHKARQTNEKKYLPVFAHTHNHEAESPLWKNHLLPWLEKLSSFQSIPANYLVPDEKVLPKESIRFFHIDKNWQVAALSGAFSVGGSWDQESQTDDNSFNDFLDLKDNYQTGFLLRSDVVDGWKGLIIDGYDNKNKKFQPLKRRLSRDIWLCLFKTNLAKVVFHQKPEVMHFGFLKDNKTFWKKERTDDGVEIDPRKSVPWKNINQTLEGNDRVVNIDKLSEVLGKKNKPAEFAMNMIEGVPQVTFKVKLT